MNSYYLDTSALFKRYVLEEGSDIVTSLFDKGESLFISAITLCEVTSNLRRLVDVDGILKGEEFDVLRATFLGDVGDSILEVIELTTAIILASLDLASKKYLTPIDAIQLATALSLAEKPVFVCSDQKLLRLALENGLAVLDPAGS
ncbi:MAG: PIN domain-containing protein [Peptococcaceae bacterium]|nr:MAG: PIN domain-containing protein [Peptococcaceae bacterium]